ncbi:MAG: hypothetical protein KJ874_02660 [Acidobacteria bacterium]|nr:hypothetical protein [Acidobacteriota bacterium]
MMEESARRSIWLMSALVLFFCVPPVFSQTQHEVIVRNVQVPVRVFSGNDFVSDLSIEDFEILKDGVPQKVEALYLVKGGDIDRKGYFAN